MPKFRRETPEWWEELNRLAQLLNQWEEDRENESLGRQALESMERLGFITSSPDDCEKI
jgi:hypothetical protein